MKNGRSRGQTYIKNILLHLISAPDFVFFCPYFYAFSNVISVISGEIPTRPG